MDFIIENINNICVGLILQILNIFILKNHVIMLAAI